MFCHLNYTLLKQQLYNILTHDNFISLYLILIFKIYYVVFLYLYIFSGIFLHIYTLFIYNLTYFCHIY